MKIENKFQYSCNAYAASVSGLFYGAEIGNLKYLDLLKYLDSAYLN